MNSSVGMVVRLNTCCMRLAHVMHPFRMLLRLSYRYIFMNLTTAVFLRVGSGKIVCWTCILMLLYVNNVSHCSVRPAEIVQLYWNYQVDGVYKCLPVLNVFSQPSGVCNNLKTV